MGFSGYTAAIIINEGRQKISKVFTGTLYHEQRADL
jgi:hypothetical protein